MYRITFYLGMKDYSCDSLRLGYLCEKAIQLRDYLHRA